MSTKQKNEEQSKLSYNYALHKLHEAAEECHSNTLEWVAAATRSNEKALHKKEITEEEYKDQQQKVSNIILGFSYNCNCSPRSDAQML